MRSRFILAAASASLLVVPLCASAPAVATTRHQPVGSSCRVYNYTDAHWATAHKQYATITHAFQLNLPHNGTFQETRTESTVREVSSKAELSASLKYSEDAIFASVEASVKGTVAHFGKKTSSKSVTDTITIHNTGGQTAYIMFTGVTRYTGTALYYNCVSHTKEGVGTVEITHRVPWQTFSGSGGGAVQCGVRATTAMAKAGQAYC